MHPMGYAFFQKTWHFSSEEAVDILTAKELAVAFEFSLEVGIHMASFKF